MSEREYEFTLKIRMPETQAKRMYAHFIGVSEYDLLNTGPCFTGAAIPNLFTLMQPANVDIRPVEDVRK